MFYIFERHPDIHFSCFNYTIWNKKTFGFCMQQQCHFLSTHFQNSSKGNSFDETIQANILACILGHLANIPFFPLFFPSEGNPLPHTPPPPLPPLKILLLYFVKWRYFKLPKFINSQFMMSFGKNLSVSFRLLISF